MRPLAQASGVGAFLDGTIIMVRREEDEADARSLMDLMMLGAGIGARSRSSGGDAALERLDAIEAIGGGEVR